MSQKKNAELFQRFTWGLVLMVLGIFLMLSKIRNSRLAELFRELSGGKKPNA